MCIYIYIYIYIYIHTHTHTHTQISYCVRTVYELPLLPNNTVVKHFYTNRSGAKCWLDIYRWGAGLVVTVLIRDIGQKVLQSYFQTASSSNTSYFQIFFLIACLEEAFIRNTIITLCSNYTIIICINNNNAVINNNNNYVRIKDLILLLKIPMGTRKNFFEIYWQFGHPSSRDSRALFQYVVTNILEKKFPPLFTVYDGSSRLLRYP